MSNITATHISAGKNTSKYYLQVIPLSLNSWIAYASYLCLTGNTKIYAMQSRIHFSESSPALLHNPEEYSVEGAICASFLSTESTAGDLWKVPSFLQLWPMPKIKLHGLPLLANDKKSGQDEYLSSQ